MSFWLVLNRLQLSGLCLVVASSPALGQEPLVRFEAAVELAGNARDLWPDTREIGEGLPHNLFGGISALEWIGGNEYILLPDRGPLDGACEYACRMHRAEIKLDAEQNKLSFQLLESIGLMDAGQAIVGAAKPVENQTRFDPEGIRVLDEDTFLISEEYEPAIAKFSRKGDMQARLPVPEWYQIKKPNPDPKLEEKRNKSGRQPNGGFESLAITKNGDIFALLQKPLLQDMRAKAKDDLLQRSLRLLHIDSKTQQAHEYLYLLDSAELATSELLAISESQFLVIERDSKPASKSASKRLYLVDVRHATDVYGMQEQLEEKIADDKIQFVKKQPFVDFLDSSCGLDLEQVGAKIEGLSFGPDLAGNRRLLIVAVDNDFDSEKATWLYAFSVSSQLFTTP